MKGPNYFQFDRYHTCFRYLSNMEEEVEGSVLHSVFFQRIPTDVLVKLIVHFSPCCIVQDEFGQVPLHVAVRLNIDPFCIRLLILLSPQGILNVKDFKRRSAIDYARYINTKEDKDTLHAVLDFLHVTFLGVDANAATKCVEARSKCKSVARIFIRRRLIARNRDVSWLVALEIWTTRTSEFWEEGR